ncbi:unnamed protein product, partial [Ixodes hexagonus]
IFGHGNFQRLVMVCTTLSIFVSRSHTIAIAVLARPVEHWCKPPPHLADTPADVWKNQSIPVEADGSFSSCTRYEPPTESRNVTGNRSVVLCDAWDYNLTTAGQSIVSEWNLVCDKQWLVTLQPVAFFGGAVTTGVTGYVGDHIGRKPVLVGALLVLVASGTAITFVHTVALFTTCRFLTAASSITLMNMAAVLLFEVTDSAHRVFFCTSAVSFVTVVLPFFELLMHTVIRHWVVAQVVLMGPTVLLILTSYVIEESPCWLLAMCDLEATERVALSAAKVNGVPADVVKDKMNKIKHELLRRGCVQTGGKRSGPFDFVRNTALRCRAVTMFACLFMLLLHFDDTNRSKTLTSSSTVRITYDVGNLPVPIVVMFVLHRLSRRRILCVTMLLSSLLIGLHAYLLQQQDDSFLMDTTVILTALLTNTGLMTAFVYMTEIFPTVLRAMGFSLCIIFGRLGVMLSPFIGAPDPRIDRLLALTLSSAAFLLIGVAALWLPETKDIRATNTLREAE